MAEEKKDVQKEPKKETKVKEGKHTDLIKQIETMSVAELAELVKALEDRFGVPAGGFAPQYEVSGTRGGTVTTPTTPTAGSTGKATYTIHLAASGDQKIAVIKALREVRPELGLKEAKDLVDGAPKDVAQNVQAEDANNAKEKLEAVGAKVELK